MSTLKRALMNPIPTLAVALKWVASMTSIVSTPGPHWPTWFGIDDERPDLLAGGLDRDGAFEVHGASGSRAVAVRRRGRQSADDTDAGRFRRRSAAELVGQPPASSFVRMQSNVWAIILYAVRFAE